MQYRKLYNYGKKRNTGAIIIPRGTPDLPNDRFTRLGGSIATGLVIRSSKTAMHRCVCVCVCVLVLVGVCVGECVCVGMCR